MFNRKKISHFLFPQKLQKIDFKWKRISKVNFIGKNELIDQPKGNL